MPIQIIDWTCVSSHKMTHADAPMTSVSENVLEQACLYEFVRSREDSLVEREKGQLR
jgi:hypothetical protein